MYHSCLLTWLSQPLSMHYTVRTTRPEKCDIFAQRYQSQPITTKFQKHCLYLLNPLRNHVKIFLSQNISHIVLNVVNCKTLSIRTDRTDKTVKTLIRGAVWPGSSLFVNLPAPFTHHTARKNKLFNFRIISILISGIPMFVQKIISLGSYS